MLLILSCLIKPGNSIYDESLADFLNVNPNEIVVHKKNINLTADSAPSFYTKRVLSATIPDPCAEYEDSQK